MYATARRGDPLTADEVEALRLRAQGLRLVDVARSMRGCSWRTVSSWETQARDKLGARNTLHAVLLAKKAGYPVWDEAAKVRRVRWVPSAEEREMLLLMMQGYTQASIDARLGQYRRRTTRAVAAAKRNLAIASSGHFELVVRLVRADPTLLEEVAPVPLGGDA